MARWKLVEPHYINAERDGSRAEWEYKEISRATGREIRKKYPVPMLLDPRSADDWNHWPDGPNADGVIIVTDGKDGHHKDIVMLPDAKGKYPITPGMIPLDPEAERISAEYNKRVIPIDGAPEATYSERLLDKWIQQIAETQASLTQQTSTSGINDVLKLMTEMLAQNQKLIEASSKGGLGTRKVA